MNGDHLEVFRFGFRCVSTSGTVVPSLKFNKIPSQSFLLIGIQSFECAKRWSIELLEEVNGLGGRKWKTLYRHPPRQLNL